MSRPFNHISSNTDPEGKRHDKDADPPATTDGIRKTDTNVSWKFNALEANRGVIARDDANGRRRSLGAYVTPAPRIAVVDDDESVRESLPDLLRACGYSVAVFSSAEEFLASSFVGKTDCLILDIAMPGMTGLALQEELVRRQHAIPVVFITGNRDESIRIAAQAAGAVDCLFKPFSENALLNAVTAAITVA